MRKKKNLPMPRPILKWAGGKHASIPDVLAALPAQIRTYYEPFFGGGAVFFALAREARFERAVISDFNHELIGTLLAVRDDVESVIREIDAYKPERITAKKYYRIRASKPRSPARKAARMIFLNKVGYNGLYRLNKKGVFNVPWGKVKRWDPDYANLRAVAALLRQPNIEIRCDDFETCNKQHVLPFPGAKKDAGYFDPPYLPESKTARFTAYTADGFQKRDHKRLATLFGTLAEAGVHVVASNADVRGAERLYESIPGTKIYSTSVARAINSNGKRRGKIGELLIVNPGMVPGESGSNGN